MAALLLPGMDGTGRLFATFARALSVLEPRVVAYSTTEPQSYDELLDAFDWPSERVVLVAESFSGPLAIRLAARHPERVRALVLAATFVRSPTSLAKLGALFGSALFLAPPPLFA